MTELSVRYLFNGLRKELSKRFIQARDRARREIIYIVSFPKCGRTWLRLMIGHAICNHFGLTCTNPMELDQLATMHLGVPRIEITHDDDPHFKKADELTESKKKYKHNRVILLVRDPRDVIVSWYFQITRRLRSYNGSLSDYLEYEVGGFDSMLRFYNIWAMNHKMPRDFILVRYEDIHLNPQEELRRVLDFIGLRNVSNDVINETVEFASFENMRNMEVEDTFSSGRLRPGDPNDEKSFKTRDGKVGGYVNYLTKDEISNLSHKVNTKLSGFYGYRGAD